MIANTIIASSLRKLLVIPAGGSPSVDQLAVGLEALNDIVKLISGNASLIFQDTLEEFTIPVGTQTFTMGPTGDFVTNKPVQMLRASIRDARQEYVLTEMDKNVYSSFIDKTIDGLPSYIYFRNTFPDSTFYFDKTTSDEYILILTSMKSLSQFPDGATDVVLPDYYETFFKYQLMVDIAPEMGAGNRITQNMMQMAQDAKDIVIGRAVKMNVSTTEIAYINGYIDNTYSYRQGRDRG